MADTKVSNMTAATTATGAELLPVVQGGANKKMTLEQLRGGEYISAADKAGADDTAKVQAAMLEASAAGGVVFIPASMAPDWSALTLYINVLVIDEANQRTVYGKGGAIGPGSIAGGVHIVVRPPQDGISYLYLQPRGADAYYDLRYPSSMKLFGTEYDAGLRLDGVADAAHPDYIDSVWAFDNMGTDSVHGGRLILSSKAANNYGSAHPDMEFAVGSEDFRGALRVAFMEPSLTPNGPYTTGGGRMILGKGAAWRPGITVVQGERRIYYGRVYEATGAGTTGATPPNCDGVGGEQLDAANTGSTVAGTPATIGGWSGFTCSDGAVTWAFIADTYYGAGWADWRQCVLIGNYAYDGVPATGLYSQLTSDMGVRVGDGLVGVTPTTGAHTARLRFVSSQVDLECGATKGSASNPKITVAPTYLGLFKAPVIVGSKVVKTNAATTQSVAPDVSCVIFADSGATNFTAFTGGVADTEITLLFTNANTTLVDGATLSIVGGNWTPAANTMAKARFITDTLVWVAKGA